MVGGADSIGETIQLAYSDCWQLSDLVGNAPDFAIKLGSEHTFANAREIMIRPQFGPCLA